jgi:hypothetical protein
MKRVWLVAVMAMKTLDCFGSDYGTTGLIDIPTARMAADGTLTITAAIQSRTNAYALTYQATPWLETTFRYTGFNAFFHYDRNYEVKVRLWQEGVLVPQVAIGIRDLVGTGAFGAEYLVASKAIDSVDFTVGVGWGRLAGKGVGANPMKLLSKRFEVRDTSFDKGGKVSTDSFFRGEKIGIFGGLSYQFRTLPLKANIEYNPDQYDFEVASGGRRPKSPWSLSVDWLAKPGISLSLSRQHNAEWGISIAAAIDTLLLPPKRPAKYMKSSLDMTQEELPAGLDGFSWYDNLLYDMERSGLLMLEADLDQSTKTAHLVIGNQSYSIWADAVARSIVLADLHLPMVMTHLDLVINEHGHRVHSIRTALPYRQARTQVRNGLRKDAFVNQFQIQPERKLDEREETTGFVTGKIAFDINLLNRLQLFDPDDPARYQFYLNLGASLALPLGWTLRGAYGFNLYNNFDEIKREANSVLPHVRSDVAKYLQAGDSGLDALFLDKRGTWRSGFHYRIFGGVLEEMFSGIGGEFLYQPHASRLAFSISANWVKQRDYVKTFKHLEYETTTAFVSAFWATPFYQYDAAIHVGRYLAKDVGTTLEVRRTLNNGWMIGLWATITDVPFDDFGEGSFDKGLYFRIPLDGFLGNRTRAAYATRIRPIQRDGGQRLDDFSGNIWFDLRGSRYDVFTDLNERMAP